MWSTRPRAFVAAALLAAVFPGAASASGVIVKFSPAADAADRSATRSAADVRLARVLPVTGTQLVTPAPGTPTAAAIADLERSRNVVYAEADARRSAAGTPNDTYFNRMWGAIAVSAPAAWDVTTGSPSVTTAVVDGGAQLTHPDLRTQIWANPGESGAGRESNGIDDDLNGFIDDVHGWDFAGGDNEPDDTNGHGTHVAGIVGAAGNNGVGVAGVSWGSRVLPLRVLGADGQGTVAGVISAYAYAARSGVRIVNLSLTGSTSSQAEYDTIAATPGTLYIAAAGNGGGDRRGDDVDTSPQYPCAYDLPNIVCVAATDEEDALAGFSNYGRTSVDLAAPGDQILSTIPGAYGFYNGTSMAAPQVSGAAALVWSLRPAASAADVKATILGAVDHPGTLTGYTASGGRLNVNRAVRQAVTVPVPVAREAAVVKPVRLYLRARSRVSGRRSRRVIVVARCSAPCAAGLRLALHGRASGHAQVRLSSHWRAVGVRISRAGRRTLRAKKTHIISVVGTARGPAGPTPRSVLRLAVHH